MASHYTSEYLAALRDGVERFEAAFEAWMETQTETDMMFMPGLVERTFTTEGVDPEEVQRRELAVAEAAGVAAKAVAVTGAYMMVQGISGPIDPIANWRNITQPKAFLTPGEVRAACANVRGRLESLALDGAARDDSEMPAFAPSAFHTVIWTAAAPHWTNHQYRVAVREAAEALNLHWKERLARVNVQDTDFWGQSLSTQPPAPGQARLRWPGPETDNTVKSMREGLMGLAKGLNLAVRNVATHSRSEISEQEGMERLGAYSHLARLLDQCQVERHPDDARPEGLC
ncbi:TIGR02391 family protein [Nocardioides salarius]|uniref:TIGR02391 family protein n=1 Tax=Nocardioides salarius TaxID=374513 RepID=UPI0030F62ED8